MNNRHLQSDHWYGVDVLTQACGHIASASPTRVCPHLVTVAEDDVPDLVGRSSTCRLASPTAPARFACTCPNTGPGNARGKPVRRRLGLTGLTIHNRHNRRSTRPSTKPGTQRSRATRYRHRQIPHALTQAKITKRGSRLGHP